MKKTVTKKMVANQLREIASIIETRGLTAKEYFGIDGAVCLIGAVRKTENEALPGYNSVEDSPLNAVTLITLADELVKHHGAEQRSSPFGTLVYWNDHVVYPKDGSKGTTAIKVLRGLAKKMEHGREFTEAAKRLIRQSEPYMSNRLAYEILLGR